MNHPSNTPPDPNRQSVGCDPKTASGNRRNSGLFSFFKWFKPSASRESIENELQASHSSSSCESLDSTHSSGTVASFSFVPPNAYKKSTSEKCIVLGPETDTYRARLKQRDKRRESDKNLTLRKKYNLFFHRDTLLKPKPLEEEENTRSLPLMTRPTTEPVEEVKMHRRTFSESSKVKKAGSYVHVKGKRRAPQPPGKQDGTNTLRKKRLAPVPPEKVIKVLANDVLSNDSLKLDHGILKPAKEETKTTPDQNSSSPRSSVVVETPVSPRPWYKRNTAANKKEKAEHKYEVIEKRNSTLDLTYEEPKFDKKKEEKRKSGLSFLTNISELDREASEIVKNKHGVDDLGEMPEFMRPKEMSKPNTDSWVSPKRRSAKDLIAKFNAITNVTRVTVFGASQRDQKLFGKQISLDETRRRQETLLESHKRRIEEIDNKKNIPLMKSESASAIKAKPETPKFERKSWKCPKCNLENEYWRIICHVCSAIKPYFDDFSSGGVKPGSPLLPRKEKTPPKKLEPNFERAKTQIGFSALAKLQKDDVHQKEKTGAKTGSPLVMRKEKTPPEKIDANFERSKTQIGFPALASSRSKPDKEETPQKIEANFERSKTQIGFSALASFNAQKTEKEDTSQKDDNKKEEKERLKKMLIEMKNSLPNRKSHIALKQNRASIIMENPGDAKEEAYEKIELAPEKTQEEKVAEILIGTTQTIYENIKVRKSENPKPIKVSSAAQTSGVVKQVQVPPSTITNLVSDQARKNNYELMRPKDFEDIYTDSESKSAARIYANLARNDELSLFFNMPKNINVKNNAQSGSAKNTDTIEINRLLKRLETSIAKGELTEAAIFAKELAQLKVNCSVIRHRPQTAEEKRGIQIEMYVEDKVSHRGPFPLNVVPELTVAELKKQVEREYEIPAVFQRWILGKELVTKDTATLKDHNITDGCPVFLYLVAPEQKSAANVILSTKDLPSTSKSIPHQEKAEDPISTASSPKPEKTFNDDRIEKMKSNVQNLQNMLGESRNDHTPKIVNVIPKPAKTEKTEITRIIPVELENKIETNKFKEPPATVLEIKVEKTPIVVQKEVINVEIVPTPVVKDQTSLEVKPKIQYVFPTIQNVYEKQVENKIVTNPEQVKAVSKLGAIPKEKIETNKTVATKNVSEAMKNVANITNKVAEATVNVVETKTTVTETSKRLLEGTKDIAEATTKVAEDAAKVAGATTKVTGATTKVADDATKVAGATTKVTGATTRVADATKNADVKLVPKASEEDFEDCENSTLKAEKEWECHLCTLLNPVSSNICAVCATVRMNKPARKHTKKKAPQPLPQTYQQLVKLDNADLVENQQTFECVVCFSEIAPHQGVTLRECLHQFCKACLAHTIEFTEEAEVKCPYRDDEYSCNIALQDREIKALVTPEVYEQHLAKSVAQAENKIEGSFHCKTPDCKGWCIFEDNVNEFKCPVCRKTNCLTCQSIHPGQNCKQYQERMAMESEVDEDARRTRIFLQEMVSKGEAIECPTCRVVLMKKWGCDWLRCSVCKTEICWVTRGPRWGPDGKGDISAGCRCGVDGVKCHPNCNYCH
ncbi:unnamed protein product [Acanthoscelides obtectus]|uniref:RanBP-type and C3HC4-type zinc finger-containing protein 1 n=1 Tax=Acanthoscelides obtectus TaxID=200917 RepID=A0A9P0P0D0_ACAOB|nr:unnamed protein product [Acanthoscelides obtectus]CAK1637486.1 RanBP-type and C3HC4-type zinc finger-containing protein 1 [Acanthoscelides obtectus]